MDSHRGHSSLRFGHSGRKCPGGALGLPTSHTEMHVSPARTAVSGRPGLSPDALRCSGKWQKVGPWFEASGPLTGGCALEGGDSGVTVGEGDAHPGELGTRKALIWGQPPSDLESPTHRNPQETRIKPPNSANSWKQNTLDQEIGFKY